MKIRCPGCSKTLNVPDTAAGKVVKCPCGKQLRAPAGPGASATPTQRPAPQQPAAQQPAAQRPAAPAAPQAMPAQAMPAQPMPAQPAAYPGQQAAYPGQAGAYPGRPAAAPPPDDMFSDLTESDLSGVKAVTRPGSSANAGPRGLAGSSVYAEAGVSPDDGDRRDFLMIVGSVVLGVGAIGGGAGLIVWDLTREQGEDDGGVRIRRRRTPIGTGIALIIGGIGWLAKGLFGGDD